MESYIVYIKKPTKKNFCATYFKYFKLNYPSGIKYCFEFYDRMGEEFTSYNKNEFIVFLKNKKIPKKYIEIVEEA